jgi:hypothetical protein
MKKMGKITTFFAAITIGTTLIIGISTSAFVPSVFASATCYACYSDWDPQGGMITFDCRGGYDNGGIRCTITATRCASTGECPPQI